MLARRRAAIISRDSKHEQRGQPGRDVGIGWFGQFAGPATLGGNGGEPDDKNLAGEGSVVPSSGVGL
jgi:hypothetical protein